MDDDLAFCLGHFIDDQVQFIDNRLEEIKQEEIAECQKIEKEKNIYNKKKTPPKNKGSHYEDQTLVDQFIKELRDNKQTTDKKTIIDDQNCIDTLHAEISTKVSAAIKYISRLRNLAKPLPNTTKFVETCNEAMDHFRQSLELEDNFKVLLTILEESDMNNVLQNVQNWWKEKYGSTISDINHRNQKISAGITDNSYVSVSPTSRICDNAKKLIAARKIIHVPSPKLGIIRKFVQQLLTIDEELRTTTDPAELIDQLNNQDTKYIIDYAQRWLAKRDEIRNQKEEEDPYDIKIDAAKAEYGRRRIAQEAKKLALTALLCRLAVGSTNGEQFDQQLKRTINSQKNNNEEGLPIITGDIKEPEGKESMSEQQIYLFIIAEELPVIIQLELDSTDIERWVDNTDGIREQFGTALCRAFLIPTKNIRVDGIDRDKGIIFLCVLPPYGKNVVDSLNGTAPDAVARMKAVRKCCHDLNANVESLTLGEFGLKVEDRLMDPRWNKKYVWSNSNPGEGDYWAKPIIRGDKPYYCPSGWKRFGIKVADDEKEFDEHWGSWYIAYHGTASENASKILTSGLKVSTQGCFYEHNVPRVYVSPSIEYCGHPRYARPWKQAKKNGQVYWYQLVFQCRVNPASVDKIRSETLVHNAHKQEIKVDPNFDNGELEWIILGQTDEEFIKNDIICYGLMMRISNVDPDTLPQTAWWKYSLYGDSYEK